MLFVLAVISTVAAAAEIHKGATMQVKVNSICLLVIVRK
jgi:hypothetical protein